MPIRAVQTKDPYGGADDHQNNVDGLKKHQSGADDHHSSVQ